MRLCNVLSSSLLSLLLANALSAQTANPKAKPTDKKPPARSSLTERALRFLGVSSTPGTLKGASAVRSGQVWIASLKSNQKISVAGTGYRSPIFLPGTDDVVMLLGDDVLRSSGNGGAPKKSCTVHGVMKLVGGSRDDRNAVLLLMQKDSDVPSVATLDIRTCALTVIPFDASSAESRQTVEDLQGWARSYGNYHLFVERKSKETVGGTQEWSDVFLQTGSEPAKNVSQCVPDSCGQPSLDPESLRVVFIRSAD